MFNHVFQTVEASADTLVKPFAHLLQNPYLSAALTQETNRESEHQRDINEGRPVIGDFAHDALGDRYHLIFEWRN